MSISQIKAFARTAQDDTALADKLKACERAKELAALAQEYGFNFAEDELYPPNEPQFVAEQLHPKMVQALLR
jgi:predicted ribosomally synthesized peptide with nif11-like leader